MTPLLQLYREKVEKVDLQDMEMYKMLNDQLTNLNK